MEIPKEAAEVLVKMLQETDEGLDNMGKGLIILMRMIGNTRMKINIITKLLAGQADVKIVDSKGNEVEVEEEEQTIGFDTSRIKKLN
jgi:hypothetical protein